MSIFDHYRMQQGQQYQVGPVLHAAQQRRLNGMLPGQRTLTRRVGLLLGYTLLLTRMCQRKVQSQQIQSQQMVFLCQGVFKSLLLQLLLSKRLVVL